MWAVYSVLWFLVYIAALDNAAIMRYSRNNLTLAVLFGGPVMWFLAGGAIVITFFKRWANR